MSMFPFDNGEQGETAIGMRCAPRRPETCPRCASGRVVPLTLCKDADSWGRPDEVKLEPSEQARITGLRAVTSFFRTLFTSGEGGINWDRQPTAVGARRFRACLDCGTVEGWLDPEQLEQKVRIFGTEVLKKRVGTSSPIPATAPALDSGSLPRPGDEPPDSDDQAPRL
jgi:hypothetical protein